MPYNSLSEAPGPVKTHKGIPLTLAQVNKWASIYDKLKAAEQVKVPAAVAWATWEKIYRAEGGRWVKRDDARKDEIQDRWKRSI